MRDGFVWVDFENTPHVLFLEPFIRRLRAGGWEVAVSVKPQAQTVELAAARGIETVRVGDGDFQGYWGKVTGGIVRAFRLAAYASARGQPRLLLSSSRSASLAAWVLRVPSVALLDYEHTSLVPLTLATVVWLPDLLRHIRLPSRLRKVARFYPGLKENLYLDVAEFDRAAQRRALGVGADQYLIVARPPATSAHYAADDSGRMWHAALQKVLRAWPDARVLVSPRTGAQRADLTRVLAASAPRVGVLDGVVPGPGLVAAADLVLGGGGTMNREAAVLGVPVWSVFCGPPPRIDEELAREGRLRWVRSDADLDRALLSRRPERGPGRGPYPDGLATIWHDLETRLGVMPMAFPRPAPDASAPTR